MFKSLREVFEYHARNVRIDNAFVRELEQFENQFVKKSEDHIAFFGGNLLGVHPMRFTVQDRNAWFDEVFVVDDLELQDDIWALPTVDKQQRVRTEVFNLSCAYLIHACMTSPYLSDRKKDEACMLVALIFQYKLFGSVLAHFFPYPTDEALAVATYRALSKKFGLKRHGSWKKLMVARAESLLAKDSIHYHTFKHFNDDESIQYICSDSQTRIKNLIRDMTDVFYDVRSSQVRVVTSTTTTNIDGEKILRDVVSKEKDYIDYIQSVVRDGRSLIKEELVDAALDIKGTVSEKHLRDTLAYLPNNLRGRMGRDIDRLCQELVVYSFNYISTNRKILPNPNDILAVVQRLKGVFSAPKNTEASVALIRELSERIVKGATKVKNTNTLSAVRSALLIYLLLRTLSKDYYS